MAYELTTYEKILSVIAKPMGILMGFIYNFIGNYGITLILFTILVRLILFPLYTRQLRYSAKMQAFQPQVQEIQRKYSHDRQLMSEKLNELYATENFSPMSGCLPMLIQFPIICGLFVLLRNPLAFMSDRMVMAIHESFLWIPDLAQPDSWILPILAGIGTYFTFVMSQAQAMNVPGDGGGMMKSMKYIFPIMIVWMGRTFPAGLTLYWALGNVFTIVQTLMTNNYKEQLLDAEGVSKKKKRN